MDRALLAAAAVVLGLVRGGAPGRAEPPRPVPSTMAECARCHTGVVKRYLDHAMARSIGPAGAVTAGTLTNPLSRNRYDLAVRGDEATLLTTFPDGGVRRQRIVGRIGAGRFDTSWVAAEMDGETVTGRLFFAPVETLAGRGLALSPFETHAGSAGPDQPLSEGCLTCHTSDDPDRRPGAVFPANLLGADAFTHLAPLGCATCHGEVARHADIVTRRAAARAGDLAITRLGTLPPAQQRDVCARCHLQGDARFDLVQARPRTDAPLAGQIPVLVPAAPTADHRFVGQLERLALSACFKATPAMTCTTCHEPHTGVAAQGTARFDAACTGCHRVSERHTTLTVREVTGQPARTPRGCVDCHVRRSQPFDLPHVRTADHFIQRRIARPRDDIAHRSFADQKGALQVYDDGRLAPALGTPEGRRWEAGVLAMGLMTLGRFTEASAHFDRFPAPGTPGARQATAPGGLAPLETHPLFHAMRGLVLMGSGRTQDAEAAFGDALAFAPSDPDALLGRARLRLDAGNMPGALLDTQAVIEAHPDAEHPWDLRVEIALRGGRPDLAVAALRASTRRWPGNAMAWHRLAALLRQQGDPAGAAAALERVRALRPSAVPPSP